MVAIVAIMVSIKIQLSYRERFVDKKPFETVDITKEIVFDCRYTGEPLNKPNVRKIFLSLGCSSEIIQWYDDEFRNLLERYSSDYWLLEIRAIVNHGEAKEDIMCYEISIRDRCIISAAGSTMSSGYTFWVTGTLQHPTGVYLPEKCRLHIRGEKN
ncbi:MAG: hypothetical protein WCG48_00710 [Candidatus Berkelbacteria bacterium]